jgi:hypothetical protein
MLLPHVIFFSFLASPFLLTKDNMDILNHFIDFVTCEMRWRTPLLNVTIEWILHTLKLVLCKFAITILIIIAMSLDIAYHLLYVMCLKLDVIIGEP